MCSNTGFYEDYASYCLAQYVYEMPDPAQIKDSARFSIFPWNIIVIFFKASHESSLYVHHVQAKRCLHFALSQSARSALRQK